MSAVKTVAVRWPAKQAEPFGFALVFWLHLCIKAKGGKANMRECEKRRTTRRAMPSFDSSDKLAQHDKAQKQGDSNHTD
jgi:hypothetical protein